VALQSRAAHRHRGVPRRQQFSRGRFALFLLLDDDTPLPRGWALRAGTPLRSSREPPFLHPHARDADRDHGGGDRDGPPQRRSQGPIRHRDHRTPGGADSDHGLLHRRPVILPGASAGARHRRVWRAAGIPMACPMDPRTVSPGMGRGLRSGYSRPKHPGARRLGRAPDHVVEPFPDRATRRRAHSVWPLARPGPAGGHRALARRHRGGVLLPDVLVAGDDLSAGADGPGASADHQRQRAAWPVAHDPRLADAGVLAFGVHANSAGANAAAAARTGRGPGRRLARRGFAAQPGFVAQPGATVPHANCPAIGAGRGCARRNGQRPGWPPRCGPRAPGSIRTGRRSPRGLRPWPPARG
jgi:hypothetical protein